MTSTLLVILLIISPTKTVSYLKPIQDDASKASLNSCILKISSKYFDEDNGITVSLPSAKYDSPSVSDSTRQLLSDLSNQMKWSSVVRTMKKQYHTAASYSKLRSTSNNFIIFLRSNVEKDMTLNVHSWSPLKAKFLVTTLTIFNNASQIVEKVIEPLWKKTILNGIVLAPRLNDTKVFDIFKWYPYSDTNCGENAGKVKIIDQCSHGKFAKNTHLFKSGVVPKYFAGCTLVAGYFNVPPYIINVKNNSIHEGDYIDTKHGIEVNLLNLVAKSLNLHVLYVETTGQGDIYSNGTATENLQLLAESKVHIALGTYSNTRSRSYFFDATFPYEMDDLVWCVPRFAINENSIADMHVGEISLSVIGLLLVTLGVLMFFFSKLANDGGQNPGKIFFWITSIITAMPIHRQPKSSTVRLVFITTVVLGFYLDTVFQTHLTSMLSSKSYSLKFDSLADIETHNLTTYFVPNIERYFEGPRFEKLRSKWLKCQDLTICVRHVALRRDSAFCVPKIIAESISKNLVSLQNEPLVHCFGNIITMSKSMLMEKGSYWLQYVNSRIERTLSAGLIAKWERDVKNLRKRVESYDIDLGLENSNMLSSKQLIPVFLLLILLHCISFLVLLLEIMLPRNYSPFFN